MDPLSTGDVATAGAAGGMTALVLFIRELIAKFSNGKKGCHCKFSEDHLVQIGKIYENTLLTKVGTEGMASTMKELSQTLVTQTRILDRQTALLEKLEDKLT